MPDYTVNYTPDVFTVNYTPNVFETYVSDGGARAYTDTAVTTHNASATAHTTVEHIWTAGQTFQGNIDVGPTAVGENGAIGFPTGITDTWWGFQFLSAANASPAYTHSVGGWGFNITLPDRPINALYPSIVWGIEGRYWNGSAYQSEIYLQYTPIGGSGTFRPISWTIMEESPYAMTVTWIGPVSVDGALNASSMSLQSSLNITESGSRLWVGGAMTGSDQFRVIAAADGVVASFVRSTVLTEIYNVAATSGGIGTFSNHRFNLYANGSIGAYIGTDSWLHAELGLFAHTYGIRCAANGLFGTAETAITMEYGGYPTYQNKIKSGVNLGAGANNIIQFDCASTANNTVQVLTLKGDRRVHMSTPATAPTDADIPTGNITFYLDETGHNVMIRVKESNGTTLRTATIATV